MLTVRFAESASGTHIGGGATVYAGFRQHEEHGKEDVDVMLAGIRVTFN